MYKARHPRHGRRLRGPRDPAACAGQVPRPAGGDAAPSGDAALSRQRQNAAGHINENYAREIMELHTMGVGSGYTQKDVQELARILTGVGIDLKPEDPKLKPRAAAAAVPRRPVRVQPQPARLRRQDVSRPPDQGRGLRPRSRRRSTSCAGSRRPRTTYRAEARDLFRRRRLRRRRWSSAWRRPSSAPTATSPRCWRRMFHSPRVRRLAEAGQVQGPGALRRSRPCAWPMTTGSSSTPARSRTGSTAWPKACTTTRRPTAIP